MQWNKHSDLKGRHARFSPSQPSCFNYSDEQIMARYHSDYRNKLGTEIHAFAASQIELSIKHTSIRNLRNMLVTYIYSKYEQLENTDPSDGRHLGYGKKLISELDYLPQEVFETVKMYINDAIGFKMNVEQVLYYSDEYFGTADTVSFRDNILRIHDLKTGAKPGHIEQLLGYAALFCLEYKIKPGEIKIELCIYQNADILICNPDVEDIARIMDRIITGDKVIKKIKEQED